MCISMNTAKPHTTEVRLFSGLCMSSCKRKSERKRITIPDEFKKHSSTQRERNSRQKRIHMNITHNTNQLYQHLILAYLMKSSMPDESWRAWWILSSLMNSGSLQVLCCDVSLTRNVKRYLVQTCFLFFSSLKLWLHWSTVSLLPVKRPAMRFSVSGGCMNVQKYSLFHVPYRLTLITSCCLKSVQVCAPTCTYIKAFFSFPFY